MRVKVLILVLLFTVLSYTRGAIENPNLLSIIQNNKPPYRASCIADKKANNSGINWIFPIPYSKEDLPTIESQYVPTIQSNYSCDFAMGNKCVKDWKMDKWSFSEETESYYPSLDERTESFPTVLTSNATKEFFERFQINPTVNLGFSIRSLGYGEMFLCEAWNPYQYPCYYVNIGGVNGKTMFLKKFQSLPHGAIGRDGNVAEYEGDTLTSQDEWRSYSVSLDEYGIISIKDIFKKTVLMVHHDSEPLKPVYLFIRSKSPALWKIHNKRYILTTSAGTTKLGPSLFLNTTDLCVSMYVRMCEKCTFTFSINHNNQEDILQKAKYKNGETGWKEVKLTKPSFNIPKTDIYVKTDIVLGVKKPFWAISNVRVCNLEELRVSTLTFNKSSKVDFEDKVRYDLACQSFQHPTWRPKLHQTMNLDLNFKDVSSQEYGISLKWEYSYEKLEYQPYFLIEYQGKDPCNDTLKNEHRKRSHNYLITREEDVQIKNLVPYTDYDVHITDVTTGKRISQIIKTLATNAPTMKEIPANITLTPSNNSLLIKWLRPKCIDVYGPLIYNLNIKDETSNLLQTSMINATDDIHQYIVRGLESFTFYTLEIVTARSTEHLNVRKVYTVNTYNFTTLPGTAPQVGDPEVYESDKTFAAIRYRLPQKANGMPKKVEVKYCNILTGCITKTENISKCQLWEDFYCIEINSLIPNTNYTFSVSLRNENSSNPGKAKNVYGMTVPQVPGVPTNITYKIVDCSHDTGYCNLNINWMHPFRPKGIITAFHLYLSNVTVFENNDDDTKSIYEIYTILNRNYQKQYSHTIKFVPYGATYKLRIEVTNDKYRKGQYAQIEVEIPTMNDFKESPILINSTTSSLTFNFPYDNKLLERGTLMILIQDYNFRIENNDVLDFLPCEIKKCNDYGSLWISTHDELNINESNGTIIHIENMFPIAEYHKTGPKSIVKLNPEETYCITFIFYVNKYENETVCMVHHIVNATTEPILVKPSAKIIKQPKFASVSTTLTIIFILISLTVGGILLYRKYKKKRFLNSRRNVTVLDENVYEQMPFEDYICDDSAYNPTYDKLIHT